MARNAYQFEKRKKELEKKKKMNEKRQEKLNRHKSAGQDSQGNSPNPTVPSVNETADDKTV